MSTDKSQCQHVVACMHVDFVLLFFCLACGGSGGLLQKCIWGYLRPILWWCTGFQGTMIIQCVKKILRKIRCTGCIQGNRIEAALTVFDSPMHDNMIFGLLHYRSVTQGLWGKRQVHSKEAGWVSGASYLIFFLSSFTNKGMSMENSQEVMCSRC